MKRSILTISLSVLLTASAFGPAAAQTSAANDSHAASVRELLQYLNTEARMNVAVQQIVQLQIQRDPRLGQFKQQLEDYVGKYLSWDSLLPEVVSAYKEAFTEPEVREILAFYTSETGRKALANMDRIIREVGRSRNTLMQENADELRSAIEAAQRQQGGLRPAPADGGTAPKQ